MSPTNYQETKEAELHGTDGDDYAVHNFDDRSQFEIVESSELFLGQFEESDRYKHTEDAPTSSEILGHFTKRMNALLEDDGVEEIRCCLSYGMCFECDNCVIYYPQDAVFRVNKSKSTLGRYVDTDYDKCIGHHICVDIYPTAYIEMGFGA